MNKNNEWMYSLMFVEVLGHAVDTRLPQRPWQACSPEVWSARPFSTKGEDPGVGNYSLCVLRKVSEWMWKWSQKGRINVNQKIGPWPSDKWLTVQVVSSDTGVSTCPLYLKIEGTVPQKVYLPSSQNFLMPWARGQAQSQEPEDKPSFFNCCEGKGVSECSVNFFKDLNN